MNRQQLARQDSNRGASSSSAGVGRQRRRGSKRDVHRRARSSDELLVDLADILPSLEESSSSIDSPCGRFKRNNSSADVRSVSSMTSLTRVLDNDHPLVQELDDAAADGGGGNSSEDSALGLDCRHDRDNKMSSNKLDRACRRELQDDIKRRRSKRLSSSQPSMSQLAFRREDRRPSSRERESRATAAVSASAEAAANEMEKQIMDLKLELAQTKAEVEHLRHSSTQLGDENTCLRTELVAVRSAEGELKRRADDLEDDNADLTRQVAQLEEENLQLKAERARRASHRSRAQQQTAGGGGGCGRLSRSSSGTFDHLVTAVENMLGSEVLDVDRKSTDGGGDCWGSSSRHGDDVPETIFAAEQESSADEAQDVVEIKAENELNWLALENDKLRQRAELLEAERNDLKDRLDQIMSVDVSCTAGSSSMLNPSEGTTSLRGLMTKVTSFRNPTSTQNKRRSSVDSLLWDSFEESNAEVSFKFDRLGSEGNRAA